MTPSTATPPLPPDIRTLDQTSLAAEQEFLSTLAAGEYRYSPFDCRMRHWMLRTLEPWLVPGWALEYGCAWGDFTQLLVERFAQVDVVEAVPEFIEAARSKAGPKARFHQSLFETYCPAERFNSIFLMHVLEHLIDPVAVLRQAATLTVPGGRLFLVVPNGNAVSRQLAVRMGILSDLQDFSQADRHGGHRRIYFMDTLQRDARAAGLVIEQSGGIFFKALANFQIDAFAGTPELSDEYLEACYDLGRDYPTLCNSLYLVCRPSGEAGQKT